ncbi:hypothetical protein B0G62_115106 [Paraburkholderia eburnea]|uniref:Immunity protein 50 of polymorphic toxin system n=1 Tax=Paraburkholderia eburnea TaxID=1189126 RepID=A0A2S4M0I0_9BURK|nr:hypothetical protein [Paraburkholderia eburnea]POR48223.1 hypothetical protein B0G62_115106 [Paraburkholderia eburnea]PRZ22195.1 hypothetical protein BX588_10733 [Paraburkholderia eburnea]
MNDLKAFNQFHDWYLDTIHVTKESETLMLCLYLQERRASVLFVGINRCAVQDFSLQNIVYRIEVLTHGTSHYEKAQQILAKTQRWADNQPGNIARLFSTCGAEIVVEFDSIEIALE